MKPRTLHIAEVALDDIAEIVGYMAATGALARAVEIDAQLAAGIKSLETLAGRGRIVAELRDRDDLGFREIVVLRYRIVYRIEGHEVWVVAVLDHRRDVEQLLHARARNR